MKKIFLILFLTINMASLFAQKPGYMGKRFSLNADMSFYPAFFRPVVNDQLPMATLYNIQFFGINYRLTAGIDAVITRKSTVGLDFNYYHSATELDTGLIAGNSPTVVREFDGYSIGAHYRVFIGNTKAPVGFYYKVETGATFYSMNNVVALGNFYINNSFGRQHVLFNRLTLNYGLSFGLVLPSLNYYTGVYTDDFQTRLSMAGNFRSLFHYGINLYGGIGILLF